VNGSVVHGVGHKRKLCVARCKLDSYTKEINILKKGLSKCNKTKNPAKCKAEINERVRSLQKKVQEEKDYIKYNT
jgi:hypothetical protein